MPEMRGAVGMVKLPVWMVHNALKGVDTAGIETMIDTYLEDYPDDIFAVNSIIAHAHVVINARVEARLKDEHGC